MVPYVEIFGRTFGSYSLMAVFGGVIAGSVAVWLTGRFGRDSNITLVALLFSVFGIFFGGALLYGVVNLDLLFKNMDKINSLEMFANLMGAVFGGSIFYGGLFGGIAVVVIYFKRKKVSIRTYSDFIAPAVPLFHGFGRIGCFLGGCCYGIESDFGFTYTHSLVESANHVSRFPVQLLEAALLFLLFGFLMVLLFKKRFGGRLFLLYLMIYAILRFFLEFLRGDVYRGIWHGLSTSQWISLFLFPIACILLVHQARKQSVTDSRN